MPATFELFVAKRYLRARRKEAVVDNLVGVTRAALLPEGADHVEEDMVPPRYAAVEKHAVQHRGLGSRNPTLLQ